MKIVFFGDSITDMGRDRSTDFGAGSYGYGYTNIITAELTKNNPVKYEVYNRGIAGDRIVDLYARIKKDIWNLNPDVVSILIGINDVWHEIGEKNGVDIVRYERFYRMILEETRERMPNVRFILCEPFVLEGNSTKDRYPEFLQIREYAKVVKKLAKEYDVPFLTLQEKFDKVAEKYGTVKYLFDGVHPSVAGAGLIAGEWLNLFKKEFAL